MAVHLPILSNSSLKTFRRCAREYQLRYERGLVPVGEGALPLRFGSLLHKGLEAWWLARYSGDDAQADSALSIALEAVWAANVGPDAIDAHELVRLEEMLSGYDARWWAEPYEIVGVEPEFRAPLRNPLTGASSRTWQLAGKLDALVLRDGRAFLVEHKSTSEDLGAGSSYWQRLLLDPQVSTYYVGADALGHTVEGCVYDVVRKPQVRPGRATPLEARKWTKDGKLYANQRLEDETPAEFRVRVREAITEDGDRYYRRGEVVRLEEEEADFAFDAWGLGRSIAEARAASRFPRNPDACERFGRMCAYFDVCTRVASTDDPTRFAVRAWPHSELTQPPASDAVEMLNPSTVHAEA